MNLGESFSHIKTNFHFKLRHLKLQFTAEVTNSRPGFIKFQKFWTLEALLKNVCIPLIIFCKLFLYSW